LVHISFVCKGKDCNNTENLNSYSICPQCAAIWTHEKLDQKDKDLGFYKEGRYQGKRADQDGANQLYNAYLNNSNNKHNKTPNKGEFKGIDYDYENEKTTHNYRFDKVKKINTPMSYESEVLNRFETIIGSEYFGFFPSYTNFKEGRACLIRNIDTRIFKIPQPIIPKGTDPRAINWIKQQHKTLYKMVALYLHNLKKNEDYNSIYKPKAQSIRRKLPGFKFNIPIISKMEAVINNNKNGSFDYGLFAESELKNPGLTTYEHDKVNSFIKLKNKSVKKDIKRNRFKNIKIINRLGPEKVLKLKYDSFTLERRFKNYEYHLNRYIPDNEIPLNKRFWGYRVKAPITYLGINIKPVKWIDDIKLIHFPIRKSFILTASMPKWDVMKYKEPFLNPSAYQTHRRLKEYMKDIKIQYKPPNEFTDKKYPDHEYKPDRWSLRKGLFRRIQENEATRIFPFYDFNKPCWYLYLNKTKGYCRFEQENKRECI